MIRNLKTMGLALVAVFAMSAMVASAAQAAPAFDFNSATKLVGKGGEQTFNAGGSKVICSEVTAETEEFASGGEGVGFATVTPIYATGKCTAFGFATHVIFGNSHYTFTPENKVHLTGSVKLTPTFLGSSVCTIVISGGTYKAAYDNSASTPMKTTITASTGNEIPFKEEAGGGCGAGEGLGSYTGNTTVEGKVGAETTDITWTE